MRAFVHVIAPAFQLGERKLASRARGQLASLLMTSHLVSIALCASLELDLD